MYSRFRVFARYLRSIRDPIRGIHRCSRTCQNLDFVRFSSKALGSFFVGFSRIAALSKAQ